MIQSAKTLQSVRCVVMRGGTSRGVFFHAGDLPEDPDRRDSVLMAAVGATDPRQVDGLGGADLLLSKVAIIRPSRRQGADIECVFGSIPPGSRTVKAGANCGNLASAVACYAWDEGLTDPAAEPLRMYNPDSNVIMEARACPVEPGRLSHLAQMSGMPATGRLVELSFLDPAGTAGNGLLPTGRVLDILELPGGQRIEVSIVDAGAQYIFVRADQLGLPPFPSTSAAHNSAETLAMLEYLRGQAAVLTGLVRDPMEAITLTPALPKMAITGPAIDYRTEGRNLPVAAREIDLISRIISSQSVHKAYAVTGAIATAAAAAVHGSIVHQLAGDHSGSPWRTLRIGHPTGIIECTVESACTRDGIVVRRAGVLRTARRIMEGRCFVEVSE